MGFMDRLGTGWRLSLKALDIVRQNKQLIIFPMVSFAALVVVSMTFVGIMAGSGSFSEGGFGFGDFILTFMLYFSCYFVIVFFNVALIHCATLILNGQEATLEAGLKKAMSRLPVILGWSAVSASVGMLLNAAEENAGWAGKIVIGLIGFAWSLMTYFVVPVLAYERVGVIESIKRSGAVFKQTWGENAGGAVGFGLVSLIAFAVIFLGAFILGLINVWFGIVVGVLAMTFVSCILSAGKTVFIAALYRYAAEKEVSLFTEDELSGAFVQKTA